MLEFLILLFVVSMDDLSVLSRVSFHLEPGWLCLEMTVISLSLS